MENTIPQKQSFGYYTALVDSIESRDSIHEVLTPVVQEFIRNEIIPGKTYDGFQIHDSDLLEELTVINHSWLIVANYIINSFKNKIVDRGILYKAFTHQLNAALSRGTLYISDTTFVKYKSEGPSQTPLSRDLHFAYLYMKYDQLDMLHRQPEEPVPEPEVPEPETPEPEIPSDNTEITN